MLKFIQTMGPKSPDEAMALLRTFQPNLLQHYVNTGKRGFKGIFQTRNLPKNSDLQQWPKSTFIHPGFLMDLKPGLGWRDFQAETPLTKRPSPSQEVSNIPVTSTKLGHKAKRVQKKLEARLSEFNQLPFPLHITE